MWRVSIKVSKGCNFSTENEDLLIREAGHKGIIIFGEPGYYPKHGFKVEITPADHPSQLQDPKTKGKLFRREACCGFIITMPEARCYFPGDTRLMEDHLSVKDIDVLALDVSLCSYLLKEGAVVLANNLPNALLISVHYGTYDEPGKVVHVQITEVIYS